VSGGALERGISERGTFATTPVISSGRIISRLYVPVGGAAEALVAGWTGPPLVLDARKGFVRLAVQSGA
jgi:hypothetical protein